LSPARCVVLARAAEDSGFAAVWFAENPFGRGVLPAAAACAVATGRLRIGIGVFNPFNRHPTLIAMEIGALDELARGRAALGIGAGIATAVERMGLDYGRPLGAVGDAFAIVRAMLRGETVDHAGRVFSARGAALGFVPPRGSCRRKITRSSFMVRSCTNPRTAQCRRAAARSASLSSCVSTGSTPAIRLISSRPNWLIPNSFPVFLLTS